MEDLIRNLSQLLAETFWRYLRPRRMAQYDFPQVGGAVVRVTIQAIEAGQYIELEQEVYEAIA